MKIEIMNHLDQFVEYEVGEPDEIRCIELHINGGDEVLYVYYTSGDMQSFDSGNPADMESCYEGEYIIYKPEADINLLNDTGWLSRVDPYDYLYGEVE